MWALLWVLGLWPGHAVDGSWEGGDDQVESLLGALIAATALAAGAVVAGRLGAGLAFGWALAGGQATIALLFDAAWPSFDPSDGVVVALAVAYVLAFMLLALALEPRRRDWATWTWPFVWLAGAPGADSAISDLAPDGIAWAVGVVGLVACAVLAVVLKRPQLVLAAALGGLALDAWLYDLLDLGAPSVLAISLLLGFGIILLAIGTWRWRDRLIPAMPAPVRAWAGSLPVD